MKLAVLPLWCADTPRVTDFDQAWMGRLVDHVAQYFAEQSGGRVGITFSVLDWFRLPHTSQQWNDLGFDAGPAVRPVVEAGLGVDLTGFSHFALVIDKFDAGGAAVSPLHPSYVHVGAQSFDPALLAHEIGHFFGAGHANLDSPNGPREYDDRFCLMGREGAKASFVHTPLNRPRPDGTIDTTLSDSGPGMAAPSLRACGWLDLADHGVDLTDELQVDGHTATVDLAPLRGAPPTPGHRVCAFADEVVPGQRLILEYRSRDGWDQGMPQHAPGWVVAHLTGPEDRSRMSLQVGTVQAVPGESMVTSKGAVLVTIGPASASGITLTVAAMAPVPVDRTAPAMVSWGGDRLDIFALGMDNASYHKAWAQAWLPSTTGWEATGGRFTSPLVVESWGTDRLDVFGVGHDRALWHKAWAQGWQPAQDGWESLGGELIGRPAVTSWGSDRLDVVGLGRDNAVWHKAWAQGWQPAQDGWASLGGKAISPPAVTSRAPERLDVFAVGLDKAMFHRAWSAGWHPSDGWEYLGGAFTSPPVVCSWGPDRLDVFGLGLDRSLWHKAWAGGWQPSPDGWEPLGGKFLSPPAAISWGPGRIDVFGVGLDGAMWHNAWDDGWQGWENLGGVFSSAPAVASWGPERLDIVAVGSDSAVWHKAWDGGWHPSPTEWESLDGACP